MSVRPRRRPPTPHVTTWKTKAERARMRDGLVQRGEGRGRPYLPSATASQIQSPASASSYEVDGLGKCTRAEAKARRDAVAVRSAERIHRTKLTLGERLTTSLEESVGPIRRMNTIEAYQNAVTKHIVPALGGVPLQMLRPGHLTKQDNGTQKLSSSSSGTRLREGVDRFTRLRIACVRALRPDMWLAPPHKWRAVR